MSVGTTPADFVNEPQTHHAMVGDTKPFRITCGDASGNAVDLTGATVEFEMIEDNAAGTPVVPQTSSNVTVSDADAGEVQYNFQAADVDTAGTYWGYFVVTFGNGEQATFPLDGRRRRIELRSR